VSEQKIDCIIGKTLRINLSNGQMTVEDNSHMVRDWLGGYGMAAKILFDELPDWVTPYDPLNKIIIAAGPLQGTLAPGACKTSISTIGPVTGGWASGCSDSHIGMDLRHAGYDMLILEGKSRKPCYILITDEGAEIRDATHFWGKTTWDTLDGIRNELDDQQLHVMSIGPAGENMTRNACVIQNYSRAYGRCGIGAVFGSKNIKAVVAKTRGARDLKIADPPRFFTAVRDISRRILESPTTANRRKYGTTVAYYHKNKIGGIQYKNMQHCQIPEDKVEQISPWRVIEKYQTGIQGYPGCIIRCSRDVHITEGPYKGLKTQMNQFEIIGTIMGRLAIETPEFMVEVNARCSQQGLDIDVVGGAIGWAMECYQRGLLTKEDADGLELNWGDEEVVLKLLEKMSRKEGIGYLLSEGSYRASELFDRMKGTDTKYYAMHIKKQDLYEMSRSSVGWGLGAAVSTRGGGHTTSSPNTEQNSGALPPDEISLREHGIPSALAADPNAYEHKAQLVTYTEVVQRMCNTTGVCMMHGTWSDMNFMNLHDFSELLSAAMGIEFTIDDLWKIGMRQLNMEKAVNAKFSDLTRRDDFPPQRELEEPVSSGPRKGWQLEEEKWNHMLDDYYDLHGWDRQSSYPTRETLSELGLDSVADELEKKQRLGKVRLGTPLHRSPGKTEYAYTYTYAIPKSAAQSSEE
jgi:aldehyde:ferredoxin oxidoreductase